MSSLWQRVPKCGIPSKTWKEGSQCTNSGFISCHPHRGTLNPLVHISNTFRVFVYIDITYLLLLKRFSNKTIDIDLVT